MNSLPKNWVRTTLEEVADWGSGGTPSRTHPEYYGGEIPWIKTGELGQGTITTTAETITELGLQNSSTKVFPKNSVAIAMYGATIGKTAILGIDAATNQACAVGIPIEGLLFSKYLYFYLLSQKENFIEAGQGAAQPNISQAVIKNWQTPLPPLKEQKRIADKLEELLSHATSSLESLKSASAEIKSFRQAVLASATSGILTKDWREQNQLLEPWQNFQLSQISDSRLGKMLDKTKNQGDLTPYLRNVNVRWFNFDLSDIQNMRISPKEVVELSVKKGDVLVCEGGEPGRCAVWEGQENFYTYQKALHRIRTKANLNPHWLTYCFKSKADSGELNTHFTGTTIKHLTATELAKVFIPLPSMSEQLEIVSRVENLFAYSNRLEECINIVRVQLEKLISSIFDKAFCGELVPQDPNDEPASVLFQRIQDAKPSKSTVATKKNKSMKIKSEISVEEAIAQLGKNTFLFSELETVLNKDYETTKNLIFSLLSESSPRLRQVFDQNLRTMIFIWEDL
jgi:type I restriction enzyme, S subunit